MKITVILLIFILGSSISYGSSALDDMIKKYSKNIPQDKSEEKNSFKGVVAKGKSKRSPSSKGVGKEVAHLKKYTLQVASFKSKPEAVDYVKSLVKESRNYFVTVGEVGGLLVYRVNTGVFMTARGARMFRDGNLGEVHSKVAIVRRLGADEAIDMLRSESPHQQVTQTGGTFGGLTVTPDSANSSTVNDEPMKDGSVVVPVRELASVTEAKPTHSPQFQKQIELEGQTTEEKTEKIYADYLLGDLGGSRNYLEDHGIDLGLKYKGDFVRNFSGGISRKSAFLGNVDISADLDLNRLLGISGAKFFVYGLGNHGQKPSEFVGDTFLTSNIEAPSTFKLYEAYWQQALDDRFVLVLGLRDLNADYYVTNSSRSLLNSTFGISNVLAQTGSNGPSIFPTTSLSLTFKYESPSSLYFQTSAFNALSGDPNKKFGTHINDSTREGYLFIWEAGYAAGSGEEKSYKYGLGSWIYSKPVDSIDVTESQDQNYGFYLLLDHPISRNVSFFLRHGVASQRVNTFAENTEAGLAVRGVIPGRDQDEWILGLAHGKVSDKYQMIHMSEKEESLVEVAYAINWGRGIKIIPDYQWVIHPGLDKVRANAQVGGVRAEINF